MSLAVFARSEVVPRDNWQSLSSMPSGEKLRNVPNMRIMFPVAAHWLNFRNWDPNSFFEYPRLLVLLDAPFALHY